MLSTQTKSFFLVLFLAVASIYAALVITREVVPALNQNAALTANAEQPHASINPDAVVTTQGWETYEDEKYPLTFKYPKTWAVTTYSATDPTVGYIIIINPDTDDTDNIRVYINNKGYVGTTGVPTTKTTVNGITAVSVNNVLVGIRQGGNYITFDAGISPELWPYFRALLETVELN